MQCSLDLFRWPVHSAWLASAQCRDFPIGCDTAPTHEGRVRKLHFWPSSHFSLSVGALIASYLHTQSQLACLGEAAPLKFLQWHSMSLLPTYTQKQFFLVSFDKFKKYFHQSLVCRPWCDGALYRGECPVPSCAHSADLLHEIIFDDSNMQKIN